MSIWLVNSVDAASPIDDFTVADILNAGRAKKNTTVALATVVGKDLRTSESRTVAH